VCTGFISHRIVAGSNEYNIGRSVFLNGVLLHLHDSLNDCQLSITAFECGKIWVCAVKMRMFFMVSF
jgi:hypothetical protein